MLQEFKGITSAWSFGTERLSGQPQSPSRLLDHLDKCANSFLRKALAAVVLLGFGNRNDLLTIEMVRAAAIVATVLEELWAFDKEAKCYLTDARQLPLENESIDAVITSPPYINVFNYHQNYRFATELLGWRPLDAAPSEIGANRKHRANRFFTVVQYCIDMAQSLDEMARVLQPQAPVILVLGRSSKVLNAPFLNGVLIGEIIGLAGNFVRTQAAERVFTNRFGERIVEDIIISCRGRAEPTSVEEARDVGVRALMRARPLVPEKNRRALEAAIDASDQILASPLLKISPPQSFQGR